MKQNDQWVQRWIVPSSKGGGHYTVSQHRDGHYGCSCPGMG